MPAEYKSPTPTRFRLNTLGLVATAGYLLFLRLRDCSSSSSRSSSSVSALSLAWPLPLSALAFG